MSIFEIGALSRIQDELAQYREQEGQWAMLEDDMIQVAIMVAINTALATGSMENTMKSIIEEVDKFLDAKKDEGVI